MAAKIQFVRNILILLGNLECKVKLSICHCILHKSRINDSAF